MNIRDLAIAIAPLLGPEWHYVKNERGEHMDAERGPMWVELHAPGGRQLVFDYRYGIASHGKMEIRADVPSRDAAGKYVRGVPNVVIGVSVNRPAAVIAKDIQRRLLPSYDAALETARKAITEADEYAAAVAANLQALREAAGNLAGRVHGSNTRFSVWRDNLYGDVEVRGGDNARLEISVTKEQAIEILNLLRKSES